MLAKDNHLQAYSSEHNMNADMIIAFLDDFANQLTQKTVIVLDNAPIHHAKQFEEKILAWKEQDLYIFFLPTYSPHLNLIETLWRKANRVAGRYEWLRPKDYLCWDSLTTAVDNIMSNVGNNFSITFNELNHYTKFKTSFIFD